MRRVIAVRPVAIALLPWALAPGCATESRVLPKESGKDLVAKRNRERMATLMPNMTFAEVMDIMGRGEPGDPVATPHKIERRSLMDMDVTCVFYVTEVRDLSRVVDEELSGAIFSHGGLAFWGEDAKGFLEFTERPDPFHLDLPHAFGEVVGVDTGVVTIRLSDDSEAPEEPGTRFAVYKGDIYRGDVSVTEIRGRVVVCRARPTGREYRRRGLCEHIPAWADAPVM